MQINTWSTIFKELISADTASPPSLSCSDVESSSSEPESCPSAFSSMNCNHVKGREGQHSPGSNYPIFNVKLIRLHMRRNTPCLSNFNIILWSMLLPSKSALSQDPRMATSPLSILTKWHTSAFIVKSYRSSKWQTHQYEFCTNIWPTFSISTCSFLVKPLAASSLSKAPEDFWMDRKDGLPLSSSSVSEPSCPPFSVRLNLIQKEDKA